MIRFLSCVLLLVTLIGAAIAQQPPAPWNVTMQTNTVADSNLTVVNRCKKNHQFQIQLQNVPFLQLSQSQVNVRGGQTQVIPVKFDTRSVTPGVYHGTVVVMCVTCSSEPTCTQDREVLQVNLTVTGQPPGAGQPPGTGQPSGAGQPTSPTTVTPPTQPPTTGTTSSQTPANQSGKPGMPTVPTVPTSNQDPCAALKEDCDRLRAIAEQKQAAADDAQKEADKAKADAEQAEKDAQAAKDAADKAARAAQPNSGGKITVDGETFDQADSEWLDKKRDALFGEWQAGKISAEEHQKQRAALSGAEALRKAREERLAKEAELKKEAEKAKAAADKAKAEADKAKADADAAQKKADDAKKEADAARKQLDECEEKLREACRLAAEAKAAADKKQRDDEAKAAAAAAEEKRRKEEEGRPRIPAIDDPKYLLDNINELGLITYKPKINIPKPLDFVFNYLRKLADAQVVEFIQTVADQIGGGPIPGDLPTALTELANTIGSFFDPRTAGGMTRAFEKLTGLDGGRGMINPRTGRKYTDAEALEKIDQMTKLMRKLRDKLKQAQAAIAK